MKTEHVAAKAGKLSTRMESAAWGFQEGSRAWAALRRYAGEVTELELDIEALRRDLQLARLANDEQYSTARKALRGRG